VSGSSALVSCSVVGSALGAHRVAVRGELDLASSPVMRRFLDAELERVPAGGELVVDLTGVTFLSAAGLREFVAVARAARERLVVLRLHPVCEQVDRMLEIGRVWSEVERGPRPVRDAIGPGLPST
jgi:anti-anti-sigma factor